MGFSLSIDFGTAANKQKAALWLQQNFEPWAKISRGAVSHGRAVETPCDAPRPKTSTGFEVNGAPDDFEIHYIARLTQNLATLAGKKEFFWDDQTCSTEEVLSPPSLRRRFKSLDKTPLIEAAIERLKTRWEAAPPIPVPQVEPMPSPWPEDPGKNIEQRQH